MFFLDFDLYRTNRALENQGPERGVQKFKWQPILVRDADVTTVTARRKSGVMIEGGNGATAPAKLWA